MNPARQDELWKSIACAWHPEKHVGARSLERLDDRRMSPPGRTDATQMRSQASDGHGPSANRSMQHEATTERFEASPDEKPASVLLRCFHIDTNLLKETKYNASSSMFHRICYLPPPQCSFLPSVAASLALLFQLA
jgi:hypothetical protein